MQRQCTVSDCSNRHFGRGFCNKHWMQWHRHGSIADGRRIAPLADRFWSKVAKSESCWLWTAHLNGNGYGTIGFARKQGGSILANRVAWELASGDAAPADLFVCHTCDTPACVRNDEPGTYQVGENLFPRWGHLFLAPSAINTMDMVLKGRGIHPGPTVPLRGEQSPHAKLTDGAVREIRHRHTQGETYRSLAERYGIYIGNIRKICTGLIWKHLE